MNKTSIEWTDFTWNPIRARDKSTGKTGTFCTRISPGCTNCYASVINRRFGNGLEYTVPNLEKVEFYIDEKILEEPLRRKKPARIFVGDMFDLFHEAIPVVFLGRVFGMMAKCPQHTFQVLTKRANYMQSILSRVVKYSDKYIHWPLPHVWLGVSVEDQKRADERIALLSQMPAAVRFLSVEPQLEEIRIPLAGRCRACGTLNYHDGLTCEGCGKAVFVDRIDWVICGGESGPGARPFNLAWAESLLAQCRAAGVPFFMKQLGTNPIGDFFPLTRHPTRSKQTNMRERRFLLDPKGGVMSEWPEALRVREFPSPRVESVSA